MLTLCIVNSTKTTVEYVELGEGQIEGLLISSPSCL